MTATYYRTDRTIRLAGDSVRTFEVRTFVEATSSSEARTLNRSAAIDVFDPNQRLEVVGLEPTIVVPGVTEYRAPEVRVNRRWLKVYVRVGRSNDA